MAFEQIVFYLFAGILLISAMMVVTVRNTVYSALFLVLSFFTAAALWILLEAEFLGIVLVLVYVGAVMVLFLFVVMMININAAEMQKGFSQYLPVGLVVAITMAVELIFVLTPDKFIGMHTAVLRHAADYNNTSEIGLLLYTEYLYPFEIAAVILLVAIIAAIVLTMRRRPGTKKQDPAQQVLVKAEDCVKVVQIAVEKRD